MKSYFILEMSLYLIKSAKDFLSSKHEKGSNISLHFWGGEWEYYQHGRPCYEKEREAEVGNDHSAGTINPTSPRKKPQETKTQKKPQETKTQKFLSVIIPVNKQFLFLIPEAIEMTMVSQIINAEVEVNQKICKKNAKLTL